MYKRFVTVLLMVMVVGGSALADAKWGGIARELAMGGSLASSGVVLNPFIVNDPTMMLLNPAYQSMYKDYAWMNIAGGALNNLSTGNNGYSSQFSGGNLSLSKEFTLGTILSYDPSAVNQVASLIAGGTPIAGGPTLPSIVRRAGGAQAIPAVQNVFEVLASYDAGTMDLGFGAMMGWSKNTSKSSTATGSGETEASARMFGFRAGLVYDLGGGSSLDAAAAIRLDKANDIQKSNAGSNGEYSASGTEFLFAVRGALKMSNKFSIVPYGTIAMMSAEPKEDTPPAGITAAQPFAEKFSVTAFGIGVGGEYKTRQGYMAGGLSLQSVKGKLEATTTAAGQSQTTTSTYTYSAIPVFNLGGEYMMMDWLAFRVGYYRSLGSVNTKIEQPNSVTSESDQTLANSFVAVGGIGPATWDGLVTLGLGVKWGNFAFDTTISEEALRRGLGLFGSNDNINTFGYITASFNFE